MTGDTTPHGPLGGSGYYLLSKHLLRRGFLIETEGATMHLTDNAYLKTNARRPENIYLESRSIPRNFVSVGANRPYWSAREDEERPLADQEVLEILLARMQLGGITKTDERLRPYRLTVPDQPMTVELQRILFDWPVIRSESFYEPDEGTLDWFTHHVPTPKIPLCLLEAHVALLVKALSAVGCGIWYSCEGHLNRRHVRCQLLGPIHAFWAQYLMDDAAKAGLTPLVVLRKYRYFRLASHNPPKRPRQPASLDRTRQQAMDLGEHIYQNRFRLREERLHWLRRYEEHRRWRNANLDMWDAS